MKRWCSRRQRARERRRQRRRSNRSLDLSPPPARTLRLNTQIFAACVFPPGAFPLPSISSRNTTHKLSRLIKHFRRNLGSRSLVDFRVPSLAKSNAKRSTACARSRVLAEQSCHQIGSEFEQSDGTSMLLRRPLISAVQRSEGACLLLRAKQRCLHSPEFNQSNPPNPLGLHSENLHTLRVVFDSVSSSRRSLLDPSSRLESRLSALRRSNDRRANVI